MWAIMSTMKLVADKACIMTKEEERWGGEEGEDKVICADEAADADN